jgi:hypothetical protein
MSDRKALSCAIAARTKPRFIEIKQEPRRKLASRFIEIPHESCSGVPSPGRSSRPFVAAHLQPYGFFGDDTRSLQKQLDDMMD